MTLQRKVDQSVLLRRLLRQKGMSSKELAALSGVSPGTISAYLNTPYFRGRVNTAKKICHALGISLQTLQGEPLARERDRINTFKELIDEQDISLKELAACLGVSTTTLTRYLNNPELEPRPATIKKMAVCLGVSVEELYGRGPGNIDRARVKIMQTLENLNGLLNLCTREERAQARVLFGVWTQHPEMQDKCMEDLGAIFLKASAGQAQSSPIDDNEEDAGGDAPSTND